MTEIPPCTQCESEFVYQDGNLFVCPECGHEWGQDAQAEEPGEPTFRDANGNTLSDGDTVTFSS